MPCHWRNVNQPTDNWVLSGRSPPWQYHSAGQLRQEAQHFAWILGDGDSAELSGPALPRRGYIAGIENRRPVIDAFVVQVFQVVKSGLLITGSGDVGQHHVRPLPAYLADGLGTIGGRADAVTKRGQLGDHRDVALGDAGDSTPLEP